jgi:hypothetical protein
MDRPDELLSTAFAALRDDLLRGDLSGLDAHLSAVTILGADLARGEHDQVALGGLHAEAERNRDILAAAAAGVRAALRRLGEAGAPTAVYAPDGRRVALDASAGDRGSRA